MANVSIEDCYWSEEYADLKTKMYDNSMPFAILMVCVGLCGVVGNIINISVFFKMRLKDSVTIMLFMLSISDMLFLIIMIPVAIGDSLWYSNREYRTATHQYTLSYVIEILRYPLYFYADIFYDFSIYISVFLAIVRCMCVAKPLTFRHTFTKKRTFTILAILFLFAFSFKSGYFATTKLVQVPFKNTTVLAYKAEPENELWSLLWVLINKNIIFSLGYITVTICVGIMARKLHEASRFRLSARQTQTEDQGQTHAREDNELGMSDSTAAKGETLQNKKTTAQNLTEKDAQVIKNVTLVCVIFIIFNIPEFPNSICWIVYFLLDRGNVNLCIVMDVTVPIGRVFVFLNASVNIFVYYNCMPKFRKLLQKKSSMEN